MTKESNAYVLGTDREELHRLGLQHQIWSQVAIESWRKAGFGKGDRILDLGSGPGFCSFPLAYMVGKEGEVIAVDKSENYLKYMHDLNALHQLNIQTMHCDFNELDLEDNSIDGMYCRWALGWVQNSEEILTKIFNALKPGGRIVIHEYYNWSTFQIEPHKAGLQHAINTIYNLFNTPPSNINIGSELPHIFDEIGYQMYYQRPLVKLATPKDIDWQWPYSFMHIYLPKLVESGHLTQEELKTALDDLEELTHMSTSSIFCPSMVELIAEKPH